jgi:hypothetical protein
MHPMTWRALRIWSPIARHIPGRARGRRGQRQQTVPADRQGRRVHDYTGRGLHSSTSQLNLNRFCRWNDSTTKHIPQKVPTLSQIVDECNPLYAGQLQGRVRRQPRRRRRWRRRGRVGARTGAILGVRQAREDGAGGDAGGRGLHSFRFQLNLSSSVHRLTQLNS